MLLIVIKVSSLNKAIVLKLYTGYRSREGSGSCVSEAGSMRDYMIILISF